MAMAKIPAKMVLKVSESYYVGIAPPLVKALDIDAISTYVTQEITPEGDGIIMRIRKLVPLQNMKKNVALAVTNAVQSPGRGDYDGK